MPATTTERQESLDNILPSSSPVESAVFDSIKASKGSIRQSPPINNKADNNSISTDDMLPNVVQKKYFRDLKTYECWVDEIDNDIIYARGRDVDLLGPEIVFEIELKDVDDNDKELVKESAVFWVKVGTLTTETGQLLNSTVIKFRRYKSIPKNEFENISQRARLLAKALGIDE